MVADGYKQTDIGVLPLDWEIKSYEEVFNFLTTATYSRADLSDDGDAQYLHYGDIHTKYHFILDFSKSELPKITQQQLKKYPLLNDGDIVMADASEDYAGICKSVELKGLANKKAIAGLHTFLLRDKNNMFVDGFRGYISGSSLLKNQFDKFATGMKVYGVSKNNLRLVQIPIPPKPEQQAIATALSEVDALIDSLESLIAKKEDIKTATMQQLLTGKKRLDGFSGEWEEKKLKDIVVSISSGKSSTKSAGTKYPIYGSTGIIGYKSSFDYTGNKLLVARVGANAGTVNKVKGNYCVSDNTLMIICKQDFNFAYYLLIQQNLSSLVFGSGQPLITGGQLKELVVFIPSQKEQTAIATILSDIDKELQSLKTRLEKTKAIKIGMMQELLTGKTRLLEVN